MGRGKCAPIDSQTERRCRGTTCARRTARQRCEPDRPARGSRFATAPPLCPHVLGTPQVTQQSPRAGCAIPRAFDPQRDGVRRPPRRLPRLHRARPGGGGPADPAAARAGLRPGTRLQRPPRRRAQPARRRSIAREDYGNRAACRYSPERPSRRETMRARGGPGADPMRERARATCAHRPRGAEAAAMAAAASPWRRQRPSSWCCSARSPTRRSGRATTTPPSSSQRSGRVRIKNSRGGDALVGMQGMLPGDQRAGP